MFEQATKDLCYMSNVFGVRPGVYQDIVNVYNHKAVKHVSEHIVHKRLKEGRSVY